jgi:Tfp pilus assembly protein PilF/SAM-dependent methyltransferase
MSRKDRRAAQRQGKGGPSPPLGAAPGAPAGNLFGSAVQHFQAGQLGEAERLCRDALLFDPQFFAALHLLGFIAFQTGRVPLAVDLLGRAAALDADGAECQFHLALALHRGGRLEEAVAHFNKAARLKPDFAAAHLNLGNVLMQQGKPEAAMASYQRALAIEPGSADAHLNLGNAFMQLAQLPEAETHYRRAAALNGSFAGAHLNLGAALIAQGRSAEAIECLRRAAALAPEAAEMHRHLADALRQQGEPQEALAVYGRALALQPNAIEARHGLANLLMEQGDFAAAIEEYRRILALRPDHAEVCNNLGIALAALGQYAEAEAHYRRALALNPALVDVYRNLGRILGPRDPDEALRLARRALEIEETIEAKAFFVECAKRIPIERADGDVRALLVRALTEGWSRPSELSGRAAELAGYAAHAFLARTAGDDGLAFLAADPLLLALLESAPVRRIELELILTQARAALLDRAVAGEPSSVVEPPLLAFCCALASQCFINEYVFAREADEWARAENLRETLEQALATGAPIPSLWPLAVAAYGPLHALERAPALMQRSWPGPITRLLRQQIEEPGAERKIRNAIPALTGIDDSVSRAVRQQYEEMPYPRWIKTAPIGKPVAIDWHLRNRFPGAPIRGFGKRDRLDVLVAGCGTGQHSIESAQRYAGAQVLAVDLSLTSLSYAIRKTRALGLTNIEHQQADILKLGAIGRTFDIIEASGVLHHLRDPAEGWRILLSLLRPGGFMSIGLYSAIARADVRATRAFITERGYGQSADDIRRCRQEIMALPDGTPLKNVARYPDFFSTSECRDLLFHVEEHQLTVPEIAKFLAEHRLAFIGFAAEAEHDYRRRFPQDAVMTDLANWHQFETENPFAFVGMYQFWVQKP